MKTRILACAIEQETDVVLVRQRTRKLAGLIGFDTQDQTRITTAVSEIARNALDYAGGGRIEYFLGGDKTAPSLDVAVTDHGKGVAHVDAILSGAYRSATGMGLGILGARRLMDSFEIETQPGRGTVVRMGKALPRRRAPLAARDLKTIVQELSAQERLDPLLEVRQQNQEIMVQLEELGKREQELVQVNQELQDTNRGVVALYAELDERADHLRRADELKSRFLSNMSHEFRTPLNSILALSRLLLARTDGELTVEQEKQIHYIRKAAENLTEIVNDLLDLAKVEAGKTVVTPVEFTVAGLFGALRGMLRPLLVGDAVALVFEDAGDIPPLVTDEGKVSQILRNFLSNAIKFTERGEVRVWAQADAGTVGFHVRDTGIGIAPGDIATIWQEFAQVPSKIQSRVRGTGLGLPLSKKLAELLGGGVSVESAPGEGSVFTLRVPRIYPSAVDPAEAEDLWQLEPDRIPVLALEDNDADAFAFARSLAQSRYQALLARSIAQAQRALDRFTPAAIVLDVMLAGEESWRFLIELKHREGTRDIPVIVVSTNQEEYKARSLGADDYLSKPAAAPDLVKALDSLVGGHAATKVLIIDDEEVSRYLVRQLLPRGNFELSEAATGLEGLRRVREDRPDIVLLDLNLPGLDGFDLLGRLCGSAETRDVPVLIITSAKVTAGQRQRLAHAADILEKSSLSSEALSTAIRHAVRSHKESEA